MLNREVTQSPAPVRRRIEQSSEEKEKRSGCLMWGAVLGVLVGIMVGIYALPPILKHYYGEKVVAPGEMYRSETLRIQLGVVRPLAESSGEAPAGIRRVEWVATVTVLAQEEWKADLTDFTLEFAELEDWQEAAVASGDLPEGLVFKPAMEQTFDLSFIVELPEAEAVTLTPEALHLSDPRVKFEVAR